MSVEQRADRRALIRLEYGDGLRRGDLGVWSVSEAVASRILVRPARSTTEHASPGTLSPSIVAQSAPTATAGSPGGSPRQIRETIAVPSVGEL